MTAAAFRATYADWRLIKTRSVVQVVLELPLEQADLAYQVLGGMPAPGNERWCAVARLADNDGKEGDAVESVSNGQKPLVAAADPPMNPDRPHKPRKPVAAEKRLAQQAGICCADPVFWKFLSDERDWKTEGESSAAAYIRTHCDVQSRSLIIPGSEAGDRWYELHGHFTAWKLAT